MHRASFRNKRRLTCSSLISEGKSDTFVPVSSLSLEATPSLLLLRNISCYSRPHLLTFGMLLGEQLCESSQCSVSLTHWLLNGRNPDTEVSSLAYKKRTIFPLWKWTGEKQGASSRGMATNTFKLRSRVRYTRIWNCGSGESKLYKSVLSKVAKRKNHQAPDLVKFTRHSPQAGKPLQGDGS